MDQVKLYSFSNFEAQELFYLKAVSISEMLLALGRSYYHQLQIPINYSIVSYSIHIFVIFIMWSDWTITSWHNNILTIFYLSLILFSLQVKVV